MNCFVSALLITVFLKLCAGLDCHLCIGSGTSDCAKGTATSFAKQTCPSPPPDGMPLIPKDNKMASLNDKYVGQKIVPKCISTSLSVNGTAVFSRGCGMIYEKADICEFTKALADKVDNCKACDGNLCNV